VEYLTGLCVENPGPEWTWIHREPSIQMSRLQLAGEPVQRLRGLYELEASPEFVYRCFLTEESRRTWDEFTMAFRVVEDLGRGHDITVHHAKVPILTNREALNNRYVRFGGRGGSHVIAWRACTHPTVPETPKSFVRVWSMGCYVFQPSGAGGTGCCLRYFAQGDPRGSIPKWLANVAGRRACVNLFATINAASLEMQAAAPPRSEDDSPRAAFAFAPPLPLEGLEEDDDEEEFFDAQAGQGLSRRSINLAVQQVTAAARDAAKCDAAKRDGATSVEAASGKTASSETASAGAPRSSAGGGARSAAARGGEAEGGEGESCSAVFLKYGRRGGPAGGAKPRRITLILDPAHGGALSWGSRKKKKNKEARGGGSLELSAVERVVVGKGHHLAQFRRCPKGRDAPAELCLTLALRGGSGGERRTLDLQAETREDRDWWAQRLAELGGVKIVDIRL